MEGFLQEQDLILMSLIQKNEVRRVETEGRADETGILEDVGFGIAVSKTKIERIVWGRTGSSPPGEKGMTDPSQLGNPRNFEKGETVLCFQGRSIKNIHHGNSATSKIPSPSL